MQRWWQLTQEVHHKMLYRCTETPLLFLIVTLCTHATVQTSMLNFALLTWLVEPLPYLKQVTIYTMMTSGMGPITCSNILEGTTS